MDKAQLASIVASAKAGQYLIIEFGAQAQRVDAMVLLVLHQLGEIHLPERELLFLFAVKDFGWEGATNRRTWCMVTPKFSPEEFLGRLGWGIADLRISETIPKAPALLQESEERSQPQFRWTELEKQPKFKKTQRAGQPTVWSFGEDDLSEEGGFMTSELKRMGLL